MCDVLKLSGSYSMHIQRIDSEIIGVHVEVVEDFFESDLLTASLQNHPVCLCLVCGLYKFQQMLLVHASSSMYMCVHLFDRKETDFIG